MKPLADARPACYVATRDARAARRFYEETLGLPFLGDIGAALLFDLGGVRLTVLKVAEHKPSGHTVLGWEVPDIASAVQRLVAAGVQCAKYEGFDQDALGVWTAPSGSRFAWFEDPDGNNFCVSQIVK